MDDKTATHSIEQEANFYIELGFPIIPICASEHKGMNRTHRDLCKSSGKAPILPNWTAHTKTTVKDIHRWLAQCPSMNIGVPLGQVSHMVGVDIDGELGEQILRDLSKGDAPITWEFTTGKGRRLLYKIPKGVRTHKWKQAGEGHEELSLICDGQQTVLPPSVHTNKTVYTWKAGRSPRDISIVDAPQWIIKQVTALPVKEEATEEAPAGGLFKDASSPAPKLKPLTKEDWTEDVPDGQRSDKLTKLAGSLIGRGDIAKEEVIRWLKDWKISHTVPPISDGEIVSMVVCIPFSEQMRAVVMSRKRGKVTFSPSRFVLRFMQIHKEH